MLILVMMMVVHLGTMLDIQELIDQCQETAKETGANITLEEDPGCHPYGRNRDPW